MKILAILFVAVSSILLTARADDPKIPDAIYAECSDKVFCIGLPDDCVGKKTCNALANYRVEQMSMEMNGKNMTMAMVHVKIVAVSVAGMPKTNVYVATGLSRNNNGRKMGAAAVTLCAVDTNGTVTPWTGYNNDQHTFFPDEVLNGSTVMQADITNGVLTCYVMRGNEYNYGDPTKDKFPLLDTSYYPIIAAGNLDSSGVPVKHSYKTSGKNPIVLSSAGISIIPTLAVLISLTLATIFYNH